MIESYNDYKEYVKADLDGSLPQRYKSRFRELIHGNIFNYYKWCYIVTLRKVEYYKNTRQTGGVNFYTFYTNTSSKNYR